MNCFQAMRYLFVFTVFFILVSCSYQLDYVEDREIRSKARFVAVLPLVNLTSYPHAGRIIGELLTTELYSSSNFVLMEGTKMFKALKGNEEDLDDILDKTVVLEMGKRLGVDTIIFGSVTEFRYKRGLDEDPVVGINIRMLDINTGKILWAGSSSGNGGCFWFCEDSLNRLAQRICHDMVGAMLEPSGNTKFNFLNKSFRRDQ